jgi:hypothetical protein
MKATREGDKVRIEITGEELLEWLDTQAVFDAVYEQRKEYEVIRSYGLDPNRISGAMLCLELDIQPAPGESDRDIYRKENGVPFV